MPRKREPPRLKQHDNGVWYVHYHDERTGRTQRESLGTSAEKEARTRFSYWLTQAGESDEELTIGQAISFYSTEHLDSTVSGDKVIPILSRFRDLWGDLPVTALRPADIASYVAMRRRAGMKDGTIRRDLVLLTAALNHNLKAQRIERVPHIPKPKQPKAKDRWMTNEEIGQLLEAASARRKDGRLSRGELFIWLALETASRRRAIETLQWRQVDLEARLIDFRAHGRAATNKRRVPVPISDRLQPILEQAKRDRASELYVLGSQKDAYSIFKAIADAAGLHDITPHTLRHTWATQAAQSGVPLYEIAGVLGDTLATVEQAYLHHCPEHLRSAVNFRR